MKWQFYGFVFVDCDINVNYCKRGLFLSMCTYCNTKLTTETFEFLPQFSFDLKNFVH